MKSKLKITVGVAAALLLILVWTPEALVAQRGGHGGGGFHGGGGYRGGGGWNGGSGWHGGGGGWNGGSGWHGGYHGTGYHGGWRGGYHGGGYWGYPRYGYGWGWGAGWGFGIGFGWGSYWPSYPYAYGYAPGWDVPYYPYYPYPYYYYAAPAAYVSSASTIYNQPADNFPSSASEPEADANYAPSPRTGSAPYSNSVNVWNPTYARRLNNQRSVGTPEFIPNYSSDLQQLRPEVRNVIRAMQGMPPAARQEQLSRYTNLSPEELNTVRLAVGLPTVGE